LALLFVTALLWGLAGVTPARADPGDLYVDGASGQDLPTCGTDISPCQTISYTLNTQASNGDSLIIAAGTYTENLTITGITLTLRGGYTISDSVWLPNTGNTVIDGGDVDRVFFIHDSDSVLENLIISGGAADSSECWGDAVWITNGDVTIRSSTIKDNNGGCNGIEVNHDFGPGHLNLESSTVSGLQGNSALHLWGDNASATIVDVTFTGNTSGDVGGAVFVDGNSTAVISDTRIISNTANNGGGGIAVWDGATAVISNSQIFSNTALGEGGAASAWAKRF
jgi:predicted outer membrane repeat protein